MDNSSIGANVFELIDTGLSDRQFQLFRELILRKTGISLRATKGPMLASRLQRRLRALNLANFELYYDYLLNQDQTGEERRELINCITTNKTSFFREQHHFEFLAKLLREPSARIEPPFNIWSSACSTGEEPYSMAMTIRDAFDRSSTQRNFTITATDIDTQVLQRAKSGIYTEDDLECVPAAFRQRFFLRGSGSQIGRYRVKADLRDKIDFRQINFIEPAWNVLGGFDVVFCRNVLIYFEHELQNKILRRLTGYLKPRGYLIVGHSEHLHWMTDILETIGTTTYRLKPT